MSDNENKFKNNPWKNPVEGIASAGLTTNDVKNESDSNENDAQESEDVSPAVSVADRIKIMQKHRLKVDTVSVGGEIDYKDFDIFNRILQEYKKEDRYKEEKDKKRWTQKKLAAHYILQGLKRDKEKLKNN